MPEDGPPSGRGDFVGGIVITPFQDWGSGIDQATSPT